MCGGKFRLSVVDLKPRVLSLDRTYAKALLNSIGAAQAVTDLERAKIEISME